MNHQVFLSTIDYTGVSNGQDSIPQVIPAAPTTLVATADADSINLTWTRVGTYDKVLIDRKTTGDYTQIASINSAASYDDTTVLPNITYTYRVRGLRNGYPSPYSNTSSATVVNLAVQNLVATPNGHNIDLSFFNTIAEATPGDGYFELDIYRKDNVGNTYALLDSYTNAPVSTEAYQDLQGSGLVVGRIYTYKIEGFYPDLTSVGFSNEASATAA